MKPWGFDQVGDTEAKAQGQEMNQMATYIMECGGMERIEHLQMHDNNNIYNKVCIFYPVEMFPVVIRANSAGGYTQSLS